MPVRPSFAAKRLRCAAAQLVKESAAGVSFWLPHCHKFYAIPTVCYTDGIAFPAAARFVPTSYRATLAPACQGKRAKSLRAHYSKRVMADFFCFVLALTYISAGQFVSGQVYVKDVRKRSKSLREFDLDEVSYYMNITSYLVRFLRLFCACSLT